MKKAVRTMILALMLLLLWSLLGASAPQNGPEQSPADKETAGPPIRVLVEEANVQFIVTGDNNRFLTDLNKEDFDLLEDKKPQAITSFSRESDVPLRIGLLVDTSNSIRNRFEFEQRASGDFLRSLLRHGKDKAFLASFDSMAELVQDFTDDTDKLVNAIQLLRTGGGTALYEAVYYACRDKLMEEAPPGSPFRRAIVILSDGEDNQSRHSRQQALEAARRAEVIIYTITTNIRGVQMAGDRVLKEFADETGGRYFQPRSFEDLDTSFREIDAELRSQYSLSYRPTTPRDGRYHEIEIVPRRKGLRVRARRGYFAVATPETRSSEDPSK